MANTYTQIHIQAVFAVRNRECLISKHWRDHLYQYITGIIRKNNHKLLIINGRPDHLHILFGRRPTQSISDLLQDNKGSSSIWINDNKLVQGNFSWQEGYGAFSYSKSELPNVIEYIKNQQQHHHKKAFTEEYIELLNDFQIDYDERYFFKPVEMTEDDE
ncbi:MAG: IS200/IS605 family transposase [Bacteroidales bacterium]|nr:IS200/IS605 family transposase [Bacteroidales bacterium]